MNAIFWVVSVSIIGYFGLLYWLSVIAHRTNKNSPLLATSSNTKWWTVAVSLVGTTISGVTFISVPGMVSSTSEMTYFQFVIGNAIGFLIIAFVLMPLYYQIQLDSIYEYIGRRFGATTHKTAASLFIVSRLIGSAFRLYLGCLVLHVMAFEQVGIPFGISVVFFTGFMWLYTRKGGINNIIWTDFFQTIILISVAILTFTFLFNALPVGEGFSRLWHSGHNQIFSFDNFLGNKNHFIKQFFAGIIVTIAMSGLDQDMMQKNLKFTSLKEAQKNYVAFVISFCITNFFFLLLGLLFYEFMLDKNMTIPQKTDTIYSLLASHYLGLIGVALFVIGVIAATFSSCASSLLALSTSYVIDIKSMRIAKDSPLFQNIMKKTHLVVTLALVLVLFVFHSINEESVIVAVFKIAGYTYGPLLGLFTLGILTKIKIRDKLSPYISIASIMLSIGIDKNSVLLFDGYVFGFEILLVNAFISVLGFIIFSTHSKMSR